jgi:hypothetical protein
MLSRVVVVARPFGRRPLALTCAERAAMRFTVSVGFDEAEHRYYVLDSDVPGLHVETDTFEEFVEVVQDVMPDLIGAGASGAKVKFEREIALA